MTLRARFNAKLKWLYPGLGIKRWLLLLAVGIFLISLAGANLMASPASTAIPKHQLLTRLLSWARVLLLGPLGLAMVAAALFKLNQALLSPFLAPGQESHIAELLYRHRQRDRGPRVVAIGGGTGLSSLLRGLKEHTTNITAIVTVADDGGSSGKLRQELGVLPPGDFRNCLAALADDEDLLTQLFQYRFGQNAVDGHSFGNLFITAMSGITGDFERALEESSKVLAVRGRIVPSTLEDVTLCADLWGEAEAMGGERVVEGESQIPKSGLPIERVFLRPGRVRAYPGALQAILAADLIAIGPGSLYTSVLPNLLVEDIVKAIRASRAVKAYICNVAIQPGETDGYSVATHVDTLERHVGPGLFDYVLANNCFDASLPAHLSREELVALKPETIQGYRLVATDLVDLTNPWRHDPQKLAAAVIGLYGKDWPLTTSDSNKPLAINNRRKSS
jgi:uncharacterized cofD-like protein